MDMQLLLAIVADEADDDDDSDFGRDEEEGLPLINVEAWKTLGDPTFKKHFRMDRCFFEVLVVAVGRHMRATNRIVRRGTEIDLALMSTLWVLATPDTFRSIGVTFGLNPSTVHDQYRIIIEVLHELSSSYITWPNNLEKEEIAAACEDLYGYLSVGGCIDGCLIKITAPLEQPRRYIDRHHDYSITLQGVCDHRLLFRDVYVGEPGSVGDNRTFQRSPLGRAIHRDLNLMDDKVLLGDGAYTLTDKLIIPFRDNGHLTPLQRRHNYFLSRCRSLIERAFALLKGKWRRLKYFPSFCLEYAIDHIMACVMLHNFLILEGQEYEEEEDEEPHFVPFDVTDDHLLQAAQEGGLARRNEIARMLGE